MAKIQRNTQKIFAGKGTNDPIAVFGSMKTGNPIYTDNIEDLQSTAYENGWADAIVADEAPFLEEMNGVQYGFSKQLAYLFQEGIPEYDAGTTYYKGSIIKALNIDNKPVLYYSLVDDNLNNPLTDATKWEEITFNTSDGGGGLEVCDIGMSLYVDETKGLRRYLNGQIVAINDNTQGFLDRLKQITTLYPSLLTTEENWQAAKTLSVFGQVGKFVFNYASDGTTVESVRLPRVVNVQGVFDLQNLGMTIAESLPQHTHSLGGNVPTRATQSGGTRADISGSDGNYRVWITATKNASSSIYQDNAHVQEEAIQYPYFIQIATGQETEVNIVNDIELNNPFFFGMSQYFEVKPNNISWLQSEGQWNSKAVYPAYYDWILENANNNIADFKLSTDEYDDYSWVVNTANETFRLPLLDGSEDLPSDTYENLTLKASGESYTASVTGYVILKKTAGAANQSVEINIPSTGLEIRNIATVTGGDALASLFVRKGQTYKVNYNTTGETKYFRLAYAKGNGSLYYYVGETVQNANLINAGRFAEVKADKTAVPSLSLPDYSKGVSLTSAAFPFTAPYPCAVYIQATTPNAMFQILVDNEVLFLTESTGTAYVFRGFTVFADAGNVVTYSLSTGSFQNAKYYPLKGAI